MATINSFNWFKQNCGKTGYPPQIGPLNAYSDMGPMRTSEFKDLTLDQLSAFYWRVKKWKLDVDMTVTSDFEVYSDPYVFPSGCQVSTQTITTNITSSTNVVLSETLYPNEKTLICDDVRFGGIIPFYAFEPEDRVNLGVPEDLWPPAKYYIQPNGLYGLNPLFGMTIAQNGYTVWFGTYAGGKPSIIDGRWPVGLTGTMSINWLDKTIPYTVGISGEGFGPEPTPTPSPSGNCGFSNSIDQSQKIVSFNASLSAIEYWPYDPNDGGGPIYNSTTGEKIRTDI